MGFRRLQSWWTCGDLGSEVGSDWGSLTPFPYLALCTASFWLFPSCVCTYLLSCVWLFAAPWTVQPVRLLCAWNSPGKNAGVGSHSLLQGIFPTQESHLSLSKRILSNLSNAREACSWITSFYNKLIILIIKCFSELCELFRRIKPEEGVAGTSDLQSISQKCRCNMGLWSTCEGWGSLVWETLSLLRGGVRIELNCRTPSWGQGITCWCGNPSFQWTVIGIWIFYGKNTN